MRFIRVVVVVAALAAAFVTAPDSRAEQVYANRLTDILGQEAYGGGLSGESVASATGPCAQTYGYWIEGGVSVTGAGPAWSRFGNRSVRVRLQIARHGRVLGSVPLRSESVWDNHPFVANFSLDCVDYHRLTRIGFGAWTGPISFRMVAATGVAGGAQVRLRPSRWYDRGIRMLYRARVTKAPMSGGRQVVEGVVERWALVNGIARWVRISGTQRVHLEVGCKAEEVGVPSRNGVFRYVAPRSVGGPVHFVRTRIDEASSHRDFDSGWSRTRTGFTEDIGACRTID